MTKFQLNRLLEYSEQEIIEEIKRVAKLLNVTPLTGIAFRKVSRVSRSTVNHRFGSWKADLEAADLGHLYAGQIVTTRMKAQPNRGKSDEELLNYLRDLSARLGRNELSGRDVTNDGQIDRNVYAKRFGLWLRTLELAGLRERKPGAARRVHSDEQLFSNLRYVWEHFGRQPHYSEMNGSPSTIKSKNYVNRFGTWRKALLAFLEFVERDDAVEGGESERSEPTQSVEVQAVNLQPPKRLPKTPDGRREISLGLRFRILRRDDFKCVLCGNNPAKNPGLILHVDHIVPRSRGGKTEVENLRTLCDACNLGRGNSYSD
ncbi:MAG: homing endonuclease associated repeat-containing protein [Hyphomicrobiales bacterium]